MIFDILLSIIAEVVTPVKTGVQKTLCISMTGFRRLPE
jgi:hypothetical protein